MIAPEERAVVLLAAGLSRRFGGPNKLLALHRGRPLIAWAAAAGAAVPAARRIAVLGRDAEAVAAAMGQGYRRVDNPDPEEGLAGSLRLGLEAAGAAGAVAVLLGDMPDIPADLVDALFAALGAHFAAVPHRAGRWGNPVVLSPRAATAARALTGDRGARALLEAQAGDLAFVEAQDEAIFRDIDRIEDLA